MAALELLPDNTVPVFSHRARIDGVSTAYSDAAPVHAVSEMNRMGREVFQVTNDLEHARNPVGFAVDPSPAVPLILLADEFSLDSIAFGTIAEAAYRTGTEHFIDYAKRGIFTKWQGVFHEVGLDYFNLVAPVSELGTMTIASQSQYGHLAQSCVRGEVGKPCGRCVKCFRKQLTTGAITGNWPNEQHVRSMLSNRGIRNYLSTVPIRLEIVLMEVMSHYDGADPLLSALKERVTHPGINTGFTRAWYEPGIRAMVPAKYYASTVESLNRFLPKMTPEQEHDFENFSLTEFIAGAEDTSAVARWQETLNQL